MATSFSDFYRSIEWQRCRAAFIKAKQGLCERCLEKGLYTVGTQVHHKIRLNAETVMNPDIALNWDNLELLCYDCHHETHDKHRLPYKKRERHYRTDNEGHIYL